MGKQLEKTVFWSWQSDRSGRETRNLIRESLVIALDRLVANSQIEERLEIDHDTRGIPGIPDIVTAILEKIDVASVFVADITPIAISENNKHVANPNVLIELGYAKKALGVSRIVTVWNTAFTQSRPEDLPFDLRGRRGPITYSLAVGASRQEYAKARELLIDGFITRIGSCLENLPKAPLEPLSWHPAIDGDPSIWVKPGERIPVNEGWGSGFKEFTDGGRWYARILPTKFDPKALETVAHGPATLLYSGISAGRVTGGLMTYSNSVRAHVPPELTAASMWFQKTGEIWGFETQIGGEHNGRKVFYGDYVPEQWMHFLSSAIDMLASSGAQEPYHVRLGVTGLAGFFWEKRRSYGGNPPVALEPSMEVEFVVPSASSCEWHDDFAGAWASLRKIFTLPNPTEGEVMQAIKKASR